MIQQSSHRATALWPSYRTIWRWHFYAGMFTIPFVIILSVTGTIYLFKPQIEAWQERDFDHLQPSGTSASFDQQVHAAVASVEGGTFDALEIPPPREDGAVSASRVLIRRNGETVRVFVDPATAAVLGSMVDDVRIANFAKRIHGELMLGQRGSYLVELAASWTLVMVFTGVVLWFPRNMKRLGGVFYPRLNRSGRVFWRDLHSVGGVWVSLLIVFLIVTGLPWATFWGDYFKSVRRVTGTAVVKQDWSGGHQHAEHVKPSQPKPAGPAWRRDTVDPSLYKITQINQVVPVAVSAELAPPVLIRPPSDGSSIWSVESTTGNRPLRTTLQVDATSGTMVNETGFEERHWIDQVVGQGIAIHEGQRFGWTNQLLALMATSGLMLLSCSGTVLWWRRRSIGVLGAPKSPSHSEHVSWRRRFALLSTLIGLAILLPLFGLSLIALLLAERWIIPRIPRAQTWLGLEYAFSDPKGT